MLVPDTLEVKLTPSPVEIAGWSAVKVVVTCTAGDQAANGYPTATRSKNFPPRINGVGEGVKLPGK